MIKVLAQMKNLRPGHDTQGRLKKVNIDQTYEGDANFMAPDRLEEIRCQVEEANSEDGNKIVGKRILKPRTETYLTPECDHLNTRGGQRKYNIRAPSPSAKGNFPGFIQNLIYV